MHEDGTRRDEEVVFMSRIEKRVPDKADPLILAARQFKIEPSVFASALGLSPNAPPSAKARESLERLRDALWKLRWVVPDEVLPSWILEKLPNHTESPIDIS